MGIIYNEGSAPSPLSSLSIFLFSCIMPRSVQLYNWIVSSLSSIYNHYPPMYNAAKNNTNNRTWHELFECILKMLHTLNISFAQVHKWKLACWSAFGEVGSRHFHWMVQGAVMKVNIKLWLRLTTGEASAEISIEMPYPPPRLSNDLKKAEEYIVVIKPRSHGANLNLRSTSFNLAAVIYTHIL